ncbi:hypothetical protein D3C84_1144700 [compost metagenome]
MPACERRLNSVAYFREVVTMPEDRPNSVSLAMLRASSKSVTSTTEATGPKTSSRLMRIWLWVPTNSAGSM